MQPHFTLHEVVTPADVVNLGDPDDRNAIWADLADGETFGDFSLPDEDHPDQALSFALNSAGVDAYNVARGGFFTLGGTASGFQLDPFETTDIFRQTTKTGQLFNCVGD
jgi:hypothetical protein